MTALGIRTGRRSRLHDGSLSLASRCYPRTLDERLLARTLAFKYIEGLAAHSIIGSLRAASQRMLFAEPGAKRARASPRCVTFVSAHVEATALAAMAWRKPQATLSTRSIAPGSRMELVVWIKLRAVVDQLVLVLPGSSGVCPAARR